MEKKCPAKIKKVRQNASVVQLGCTHALQKACPQGISATQCFKRPQHMGQFAASSLSCLTSFGNNTIPANAKLKSVKHVVFHVAYKDPCMVYFPTFACFVW